MAAERAWGMLAVDTPQDRGRIWVSAGSVVYAETERQPPLGALLVQVGVLDRRGRGRERGLDDPRVQALVNDVTDGACARMLAQSNGTYRIHHHVPAPLDLGTGRPVREVVAAARLRHVVDLGRILVDRSLANPAARRRDPAEDPAAPRTHDRRATDRPVTPPPDRAPALRRLIATLQRP
jgi:hypothetical protein